MNYKKHQVTNLTYDGSGGRYSVMHHPSMDNDHEKGDICEVNTNLSFDEDEAEYFAKIFAAAPKMLRTLKHIKYCIEKNQPMGELTLNDINNALNL